MQVAKLLQHVWRIIRNVFSWKNKTALGRVIWCVIAFCILTLTAIACYEFYDSEIRIPIERSKRYTRSNVGTDFFYCNRGRGKSYVARKGSEEKVLTGLDWIARSADGDHFVAFARHNGKRGFFNKHTARVEIEARYDAVWCFNDGVAGVCDGDSVFFIDHSERPINFRKYKRIKGYSYTYHGDYFVNVVDGRYGLVDRQGRDATPAIYQEIFAMNRNMWATKLNGRMGVIDDKGRVVVPNLYAGVEVYPEGGIVVMEADNSKKRLDYEGKVMDEFVYDFTYTLDYLTKELEPDGIHKKAGARLSGYSSNGHCGLIGEDGKPVTPPIYNSINAFSDDLYECQIDGSGEWVMINSKGEKVN